VQLDDSEWDDRAVSLANRERWIMDGSYDRTLHIRLPRADVVILLDFPRLLCTRRVIKRMLTNLGTVRPDMADGCPEKFAPSFLRFVWNYHRDRMPTVKRRLAEYFAGGSLVILKDPKSTIRFLDDLADI
jgi:adenylate kinase family enzyme